MTNPELAGVYCRLSLAIMGDTTKVEDQARICRDLAAARGWTVPDEFVYKDNNKSAWQKNRKRPGWNKMLEDIAAGKFANLVVYHGDRLVRHPADLEKLIELTERGGMTITSPAGRKSFDDGGDLTWMRIEAAINWKSSDDTSRRKKDGFRRMARDGVAPWAGGRWGRGFGYDTAGRVPVPEEAEAIREAASRVLAGELLTAIAADLTARGIRSVSGKPMDWHTLQRILLRPRIAGLMRDGTPGSWEPILDRETWEMTRATLKARAVSRPASENSRYLLSGIAVCSLCGNGMQRHSTGRAGRVQTGYGCVTPGCRKVHRSMEHLDAYVTGRTVERLSSPGLADALANAEDPGAAEIIQLEKRRAEVRTVAGNLADHPGADLELLTAAIRSFDVRLAELRGALRRSEGQKLLSAHAGISDEDFDALPLPVRRSLIAACYTVEVKPSSKRGPGFRTEDVDLTPR